MTNNSINRRKTAKRLHLSDARLVKISGAVSRVVPKRAFDLAVAAPALMVSAVPIAFAAAALAIDLQENPFFIQERVGKDGKRFKIYKLKSMKSGDGSDEERKTKLGHWMREHHFDELPQFWNVVKGDMSIVGRRALTEKDHYARRLGEQLKHKPGVFPPSEQRDHKKALGRENEFDNDIEKYGWVYPTLRIFWIATNELTVRPVKAVFNRSSGAEGQQSKQPQREKSHANDQKPKP